MPFQWGMGYTVEGAGWIFVFAFLSLSLRILFCPQIGDHKFSAHRIVLAASIPYFHAMFTNDMMECKQDEIVMQGMDPRYQTSIRVTGCFQTHSLPRAWGPSGPAAGRHIWSTAPRTQ